MASCANAVQNRSNNCPCHAASGQRLALRFVQPIQVVADIRPRIPQRLQYPAQNRPRTLAAAAAVRDDALARLQFPNRHGKVEEQRTRR